MEETISPAAYPYIFNEPIYVLKEVQHTEDGQSITEPLAPLAEHLKGNLDSDTVVIVKCGSIREMVKSESSFLEKVMMAVQKDSDSLAFVYILQKESFEFSKLDTFKGKNIISFGIDYEEMGEAIRMGELTQSGSRTLLAMPCLKEIEEDIAMKKILWKGLKSMFEMN